ncbi:hypothetical protein GCM10007907_19360 [Chitinimonas prasina]|uniref:HD-GYP domain-containing protein n=1 Tax=Chitinimonas prasina TaxID=1434937 RepID=A0ABQ5YDV4_9NEIS|nr:HD domain-containing phosphohydrolase [Chitinimonas prasina]GLR13146.1 hypothetical protein GCM10007907_19360 [Chitinimonas prasina]
MSQSRVRHSDIEVGKALPWDVYDEKGTLLLRKGYLINNEGQVDRLVAVGVFADSNALRQSRIAQVEAEDSEPEASPAQEWLDLRKKMELLYENVELTIQSGQFISRITEIARCVDNLCGAKPELAQAIISLRQDGRYSSRHLLDSATIARLAARDLKLTPAREFGLICAALTMNLGTTCFQDEIKAQSTPLTDEQKERLHKHPEEATTRLKSMGVNDPIWLRAVLEHHEHFDGTGYPNGTAGHELSPEGQILRLADIYCARITFREYRSAVPLTVALRGILLERGKTVDQTLAAQFIRAVGIFPPGLQLRLANGEKGVVVRPGSSPNHPLVVSLIGNDGLPLSPPLQRDTQNPLYGVGETIDPATFNAYVDIDSIWG